jgi:SLOG cluster2
MLALENMRVGLSGAMPDEKDLAEHGWSDLDIRTTVLRLVEAVLRHGGTIVHGTHPSFLPLIRRAAETQSDVVADRHPVTMFVVAPYLKHNERETLLQSHEWYANVRFIGEPALPAKDHSALKKIQRRTLEVMRHQMVDCIDALVCVGGRTVRTGVPEPGVAIECRLAVKHGKPVYLVAGLGGFTQFVRQNLPPLPANGLSDLENARLAESANPAEIVSLVTNGLQRIAAA